MKVEASSRWEDSAQHRDHRFGSVHTSNHDSVVRIFLRVVKYQLFKFLFALCGTIFTRSVIPEGIVSSSPVNGNTQSCIAVFEVCTCDQWRILAGSVRQWERRWSSFHSPAECNAPQAKSEVCKVLDWTHQQKFRSRKCTYLHGKNLYICLWGSHMESSFVIMLVLPLLNVTGQSCICLWCQEFWHQTFNVHYYSMASQTYQSPTTNPSPSVKGQKKAPNVVHQKVVHHYANGTNPSACFVHVFKLYNFLCIQLSWTSPFIFSLLKSGPIMLVLMNSNGTWDTLQRL